MYVCRVKSQKFIVIKLLLLQVLLWTSGQTFSQTSASPDLDSRHGVYFQEDQNDKALILEESSEGIHFQVSSEKENNFSPSYFGNFFTAAGVTENSLAEFTSDFQPDQKSILKSRIFPFHYFW